MFNLYRYILLTIQIFILIGGCQKEKNTIVPDESKRIIFKELNTSIGITATPFKLDINNDEINDFEIDHKTFTTDMDTLNGFFVKNLGAHKMIQVNGSHNPLFDSQNLMSYTGGETISDSLLPEYSWNTKIGVLVLRHNPNGNFIAHWSDGKEKMMGIALTIQGEMHYGWIKLR